MIWFFILLIVAGSVGAVTFPLFKNKLQSYILPNKSRHDFSQASSYLSALSDLENDLALDRLSKSDYQKQKLFLQRRYLECQKTSQL